MAQVESEAKLVVLSRIYPIFEKVRQFAADRFLPLHALPSQRRVGTNRISIAHNSPRYRRICVFTGLFFAKYPPNGPDLSLSDRQHVDAWERVCVSKGGVQVGAENCRGKVSRHLTRNESASGAASYLRLFILRNRLLTFCQIDRFADLECGSRPRWCID